MPRFVRLVSLLIAGVLILAATGCQLVILDPTASGALTMTGSATLNSLVGGEVDIDSNSPSAAILTGSSRVDVSNTFIVGCDQTLGTAAFVPPPQCGSPATPDPFAGALAPAPPGPAQGSVSVSSGTRTINPGVYTSLNVTNTGTLVLNPGVYVLTGSGINVSGAGTLVRAGLNPVCLINPSACGQVMIYLTCATYPANVPGPSCAPGQTGAGLNVTSTGLIGLVAGANPDPANPDLLLFSDQNNTAGLTFTAQSGDVLIGSLYAKSGHLRATGAGGTFGPFPSRGVLLRIVVDSMTLTGSGTFYFDPPASEPPASEPPVVGPPTGSCSCPKGYR